MSATNEQIEVRYVIEVLIKDVWKRTSIRLHSRKSAEDWLPTVKSIHKCSDARIRVISKKELDEIAAGRKKPDIKPIYLPLLTMSSLA